MQTETQTLPEVAGAASCFKASFSLHDVLHLDFQFRLMFYDQQVDCGSLRYQIALASLVPSC